MVTHICGDCGDELIDNPDRGEAREVTVEVTPGLPRVVTVFERAAYLHLDDTPQCMSRADAEQRKRKERKTAECWCGAREYQVCTCDLTPEEYVNSRQRQGKPWRL